MYTNTIYQVSADDIKQGFQTRPEEPTEGLEPPTCSLQVSYSTIESRRHIVGMEGLDPSMFLLCLIYSQFQSPLCHLPIYVRLILTCRVITRVPFRFILRQGGGTSAEAPPQDLSH